MPDVILNSTSSKMFLIVSVSYGKPDFNGRPPSIGRQKETNTKWVARGGSCQQIFPRSHLRAGTRQCFVWPTTSRSSFRCTWHEEDANFESSPTEANEFPFRIYIA